MRTIVNKISTVLDLDGKGFVSQLKTVRTNVQQADGAFGKLKAGASGLGGILQANVAAAATAAGAALVTFGAKAASAFQEAALEADKFSDATGVSAEEASKWISVADDFGLKGDAIQGSLLKMNKALADGKSAFEDYGVAVVKTDDGVVDANATFINALSTIGAIEDPTMRAKAAQEVFGRSYAEVARLMEMDAAEIKAALDSTSDAQIIDEGEIAKAKRYQASLDQLGDVFVDLQMQVGELVVSLAPAIERLAKIAGQLAAAGAQAAEFALGTSDMTNAYKDFEKAFRSRSNTPEQRLKDIFNASVDAKGGLSALKTVGTSLFSDLDLRDDRWKALNDTFMDLATTSPELAEALREDIGVVLALGEAGDTAAADVANSLGITRERFNELSLVTVDAADAMADGVEGVNAAGETFTGTFETAADVAKRYERAASDVADETREVEDALEDADDALSELKGNLDDRQAWRNVQDSVEELREKIGDNESSWRDLSEASDDAIGSVADYVSGLDTIPPEVKSQIYSELDQGNLDLVLGWLDKFQAGVDIPVRWKLPQGASVNQSGQVVGFGGRIIAGATGGIVNRPTMAMIGEAGPEAVIPLNQSPGNSPLPAIGLGGGGNTYNVTIQAGFGVNGTQLGAEFVKAIKAYERVNGKGWRK